MIVEYQRPQKLDDALRLLSRTEIMSVPMGGGTLLSMGSEQACAVIDLQSLGLQRIKIDDNTINIGATARLNDLMSIKELPSSFKAIVNKEKTFNLRQMSTVAGTLASCDGKSRLAAVLLAMDAQLIWMPGQKEVSLEDWFPNRASWKGGLLITDVLLPRRIDLSYETVSSTPDNQPVIGAFVVKWEAGRVRIVAGGFGSTPVVIFDDNLAKDDILSSVQNYSYPDDQWASAEYRQDVMVKIARRIL